MKKVLITGPTGAIGIALINSLIKRDIQVTAVCHKGSKRISNIPVSPMVKVVECNLEELTQLPEMTEKDYDTFYHFAWACTVGDSRNNIDAQIKNIQYTITAVEVAKEIGCTRFIGAGSQAEYGRYEGKLDADIPTFPENGYGIAKLCAGQLSRIRCNQLGIQHIWTRVLSVYGPYDGEKTMIMSLIKNLLTGEKPHCTLGNQIWDYIYSKDAAEAFYQLGQAGRDGEIYCIGSGVGLPLRDYINTIKDKIDEKLEIGYGDIPYSDKQVMYLVADIQKLISDTDYETSYSFEKGITETIEWYRERNR